MRNGASSAKPRIRLAKMNDASVRSSVERIHIETETAYYKHSAITRDAVVNRSSAGTCDAEHCISRSGVDESGDIILGDESDRSVIGQIHSVHSNGISPCLADRASGCIKYVQSRILSYRIADNCRDRRAISRSCDLP